MRNANSQLPSSMIPVRALHQPPAPHVSHAEIGAQGDGGQASLRGALATKQSSLARPALRAWIALHIVRRVTPHAGSQ
jgi:hypothetical protein